MTIVKTYNKVQNTLKSAQAFGAILAVDYGYTNRIEEIPNGHRVVCNDTQRAVEFLKK